MLKIIKFPDPILREQMPTFDFENPITDPKQLEKEMLELMYQSGGIGLSANQVGVRARMFVMGHAEHPDEGVGIFNPVVVEAEGTRDDEEGCLSFPGIFAKVKRPNSVKAQWYNSSGELQQGQVTGYTCRCFLHELDHLDGVVFQDRVSPLKWALGLKKLQKNKRKY